MPSQKSTVGHEGRRGHDHVSELPDVVMPEFWVGKMMELSAKIHVVRGKRNGSVQYVGVRRLFSQDRPEVFENKFRS